MIKNGIEFDKGLNKGEFEELENKFSVKFPEDYKIFLDKGLPISNGFINWREGLKSNEAAIEIINKLNWPLDGLLYDVQHNNYWDDKWGQKPNTFDEAKEIIKREFCKIPKLIPVYGHRYIPMEPNEIGNPIFSLYQMDVIIYGNNLVDYFANEFKFELPNEFKRNDKPKFIRFWSEIIK